MTLSDTFFLRTVDKNDYFLCFIVLSHTFCRLRNNGYLSVVVSPDILLHSYVLMHCITVLTILLMCIAIC